MNFCDSTGNLSNSLFPPTHSLSRPKSMPKLTITKPCKISNFKKNTIELKKRKWSLKFVRLTKILPLIFLMCHFFFFFFFDIKRLVHPESMLFLFISPIKPIPIYNCLLGICENSIYIVDTSLLYF